MERLCIIDHAAHRVYFEDVDSDFLNERYDGEEEKYIEDNYTFDGDYSWDYIIDAEYLPNDYDGDFIDIDFDELKK